MTAPTYGISRTRNERMQPRNMLWEDQHGRKWEVEVDPQRMSWVGPPILKNARPPLDGAQDYLEPVLNEFREPIMGKIFVNYRKWRTALSQRSAEWKDALRETAKKMYPSNVGEVLRNPPIDLLVEVGPGPAPIEFVEAMEAGNKWALGLTPTRPKWVTDDMLDRVSALRKTTGWRESVGPVGEVDVLKYLDDEDAADPHALGGKTVPMTKGKR